MNISDNILKKLYKLAKKSLKKDNFPVAAVIFDNTNKIIGYGYNNRKNSKKTIDHAEINAINMANKKLKSNILQNTCMVVTLEPCDMCKNVIKEARINSVFYLNSKLDFKKQYTRTTFSKLDINDILNEEYIYDITHFFQAKR